MLHFQEKLFIVVYSAKHTHYFLGVKDKFGELYRWKHIVLIEIEDVASKKVEHQISGLPLLVCFESHLSCSFYTTWFVLGDKQINVFNDISLYM